MTYQLCLKLCENSNYTKEVLKSKFDVLYLMNSLTEEEYKTLCEKLNPTEVTEPLE